MNAKNLIGTFAIAIFASASCSVKPLANQLAEPLLTKGDVGFYTENRITKTELSENGTTLNWVSGDKISLWAYNQAGDTLALKNQEFVAYAGVGMTRAYFTSHLENEMPEGSYLYGACYPTPTAVDSTTISFEIPSEQNGLLSDVDFMVAQPCEAAQLKKIGKVEDYSRLKLNFSHRLHILRFYIPEDCAEAAEGISSFTVSLPEAVAGTYVCQAYGDGSEAYLQQDGATSTINVSLNETLKPSSASNRQYAYVAVMPFEAGADDVIRFSADPINTKLTSKSIALEGRSLKAGHITSVAFKPAITDSRDFTLTLTDNQIGEPVKKIKLTGPEGLKWAESGNNILELSSEEGFEIGQAITKGYTLSKSLFENINAKIEMELTTDHIFYSGLTAATINASNKENFHISAGVAAPALLFEDFSKFGTWSKTDGTSTGVADAGEFATATGWYGARAGASEGKCIRMSCRHSWTWSNNAARVNSAALKGQIIAPVDLELTFDYGVNVNSSTRDAILYTGITTEGSFNNSNNTTGCDDNVTSKMTIAAASDGSYDSTPNEASFVLNNVAAGSDYHIAFRWRHNFTGSGDQTNWIYIDNVKVKVKAQ